MKIVILFLMTFVGSPQITTAEFSSMENCEAAGIKATQKFDGVIAKTPRYICVQK